jgi:hypothetical protein
VSAWGNSWLRAWGNSWGPVWRPTGGGDDSHVDLVKLREGIKRAQEERDRLEAERIAEAQREAAEVLARLARANEPGPFEPVRIPLPEAVEPEPVGYNLSPTEFKSVNAIVSQVSIGAQAIEYDALAAQAIALNMRRARDEDEALALIMILAEFDD